MTRRLQKPQRVNNETKRATNVKVTFIYGNARLGKTTYIYDKYKMSDVCRVNNYSQGTFETYKNQKVLVLDEFTGRIDLPFLNNLLDRYPVDLPARFSNRTACFEEVYIISNLPLHELYKDEQNTRSEVYNAFTQRIHEIIRFTALGKWHFEKRQSGGTQQLEMIPIENDENLPF